MLIVKRYTAAWCHPCKQLAPIFEELQNEMTNEIDTIVFQTIDVDQNKEKALEANVGSVPTVIFEKNGIPIYRFSGILPKSVIVGVIQKFL
jgi:thioredoxin 1